MYKLPSIDNETELVKKMLTDDREGPEIAKDYGIGTKLLNERMRHQRSFYLDLDSMDNEDVVSAIKQIGGSIYKQARWFKLSHTTFRNSIFNKLMDDETFIKYYISDNGLSYTEYNTKLNLPGFLTHTTVKRRAHRLKATRSKMYNYNRLNEAYYTNEEVKNRAKVRREHTMLDRYGAKYPLQSLNSFNKLKKTNLERYGSETILTAPVFLDRYNRGYYSSKNIGSGKSNEEVDLASIITASYKGKYIKTSYRPEFLNGKEIDILLKNKYTENLIGVEFNGLYWHSISTDLKDNYYHYNKSDVCYKNKVNLLMIWENDWNHRKYPYIQAVSRMTGYNNMKEIKINECIVNDISIDYFLDYSDINSIEKYSSTIKDIDSFYEIKSPEGYIVGVYEYNKQGLCMNIAIDNNIRLSGSYDDLISISNANGILIDDDYSNYLCLSGFNKKVSLGKPIIFKNYKNSKYDIANSGYSIIYKH